MNLFRDVSLAGDRVVLLEDISYLDDTGLKIARRRHRLYEDESSLRRYRRLMDRLADDIRRMDRLVDDIGVLLEDVSYLDNTGL